MELKPSIFLTSILVYSVRVAANYFDGVTSELHRIEIEIVDDKLVLFVLGEVRDFPLNQVKIKDSLGSTCLSIELPNGGRIDCPGIKYRSELGLKGAGKFVKFLEKRVSGILVSLFLAVFGVWACGAYLIPLAAKSVLHLIPEMVFDKVDSLTLNSLDEKFLLPSKLGESKKKEIVNYFEFLNQNSEKPGKRRIEFRESKTYLPNAFALSGSTIVLTDDLVELLEEKEAIGAILAHELGHHELAHVKSRIVYFSMASILIALTTGDFSNTIGLLSSSLWQLQLSREDEFEADDFGAKLIKKVGSNPVLLASGLERLEAKLSEHHFDNELLNEATKLISTHPETKERAARIRRRGSLN